MCVSYVGRMRVRQWTLERALPSFRLGGSRGGSPGWYRWGTDLVEHCADDGLFGEKGGWCVWRPQADQDLLTAIDIWRASAIRRWGTSMGVLT